MNNKVLHKSLVDEGLRRVLRRLSLGNRMKNGILSLYTCEIEEMCDI